MIKLPLEIITEYVHQLEANLSSVQARCTELLLENRELRSLVERNEFICDGTCTGTEFGECSHDKK